MSSGQIAAAPQQATWMDTASSWISWSAKKTGAFIDEASKEGDTQQRVQAASRATLGLGCASAHPYYAGAGLIAFVAAPEYTKTACRYADRMISSVWNQMGFKTKIAFTVAGSALLYATGSATVLAAGIAFKVAAEYCQKNKVKEEIAHESKKLEAKAEAAG